MKDSYAHAIAYILPHWPISINKLRTSGHHTLKAHVTYGSQCKYQGDMVNILRY